MSSLSSSIVTPLASVRIGRSGRGSGQGRGRGRGRGTGGRLGWGCRGRRGIAGGGLTHRRRAGHPSAGGQHEQQAGRNRGRDGRSDRYMHDSSIKRDHCGAATRRPRSGERRPTTTPGVPPTLRRYSD